MPETRPPIDLAGQSLDQLAERIADRSHPPVERWNPDALRRQRDAHRARRHLVSPGPPIGREAMVRLFATVLRREPDGSHVLVTPVEKLSIEVEATAFRALDHDHGRRRRSAPHRLRARQRRRGHRRPRPPADRRRHPRRPLAAPRRPPRARGRAGAPALLRARRHRAGRGPRPARRLVRRRLLRARIAAPHEPRRADRRGAGAGQPRRAARRRRRSRPRPTRCARPRCWSRSPTAPSPASS